MGRALGPDTRVEDAVRGVGVGIAPGVATGEGGLGLYCD